MDIRPELRRDPPDMRPLPPSDPALVERIRAEIEATGPLTFARFMELALADPEHGYYATADDRPTRAGDFLTAPELHPIFGAVLARSLDEQWRALERPGRFLIREYGAGTGALAEAILRGLAADRSELLEAVGYEAVELHEAKVDRHPRAPGWRRVRKRSRGASDRPRGRPARWRDPRQRVPRCPARPPGGPARRSPPGAPRRLVAGTRRIRGHRGRAVQPGPRRPPRRRRRSTSRTASRRRSASRPTTGSWRCRPASGAASRRSSTTARRPPSSTARPAATAPCAPIRASAPTPTRTSRSAGRT